METSSGDDASHSNSHWSQERLHADAHRAVGGHLNLLRELSRVSQELDSSLQAEWMMKRIQFFAFELLSEVDLEASEGEKLAALNRFFFKKKAFSTLPPAGASSLEDYSERYRLSRVLTTRSGAPTVLAILYAYLAEKTGVQLKFVDLKPTCFLKWCDNGHSRFIDFTRTGSTLSSDELIETLHTRFSLTTLCNASLLETFNFDSYLIDYISDLKKSLGSSADPEHLLYLQNVLISYQPSRLQLLGERALLHRRLGNFKNALADLKRYFAFHDRAKAPEDLVRLYDDLIILLERHRTNIEVLD